LHDPAVVVVGLETVVGLVSTLVVVVSVTDVVVLSATVVSVVSVGAVDEVLESATVVVVASVPALVCGWLLSPPDTAQAEPPESTTATAIDAPSLTARSVRTTTRPLLTNRLLLKPSRE
jgi:hypothetical protein